MFSRKVIYLVLPLLALILLSCAKLDESQNAERGEVAVVKLPHVESIPLDWGDLVSVSRVADYNVYQLFFRDGDGAVRIVSYNLETNSLYPNVRLISRK